MEEHIEIPKALEEDSSSIESMNKLLNQYFKPLNDYRNNKNSVMLNEHLWFTRLCELGATDFFKCLDHTCHELIQSNPNHPTLTIAKVIQLFQAEENIDIFNTIDSGLTDSLIELAQDNTSQYCTFATTLLITLLLRNNNIPTRKSIITLFRKQESKIQISNDTKIDFNSRVKILPNAILLIFQMLIFVS